MHIRTLISPMLAATVPDIPAPGSCRGGCLYEPKLDGFRAVAQIDDERRVTLYSRRCSRFNETFPEVAAALRDQLPAATVVDGEIVRWSPEGRLDFDALQHRMAAGRRATELARTEPCHIVLFDVLEADGADQRHRPLRERRAALEQLLAGSPAGQVVLCPQTADIDEARLWFESLSVLGVEGLVIKAADQPYLEGQRRWGKVRRRTTTEMIVGGVVGSITHPRAAILGRYTRAGDLRVVARANVPPANRVQLAQALTPAGGMHPWPEVLPSGWAGSLYGSEPPTHYVRVVPDLVVEVEVDVAAEHGRWRHAARWRRLRPDRHPDDVPHGLHLE